MLPRLVSRSPDTCETCRFWQLDEEFEDNVLGECRLKAARANTLAIDVGRPGPSWAAPRRWPLTESRDWCAEWRRTRDVLPSRSMGHPALLRGADMLGSPIAADPLDPAA